MPRARIVDHPARALLIVIPSAVILTSAVIVRFALLALSGGSRGVRIGRAHPSELPRGWQDRRVAPVHEARPQAVGAMADDSSPPRRRKVYVLGREARLDVEVAARAIAAQGQLVLLSLGFPVSVHQSRVVEEALGLAKKLRVAVDAVLVTTPERLVDFVTGDDEVSIFASRRERRTIELALGAGLERSRLDFPRSAGVPTLGLRRRWARVKRAESLRPSPPGVDRSLE